MNRNIDILFINNDEITVALTRVLQKYTDITLFEQNDTYKGFLPDIVVITATDIQNALKQRLEAVSLYPDVKLVYVRKHIDATILGVCMLTGFDGIVDTNLTGDAVYRILHSLAESPKTYISPKKRANLIVQHTSSFNTTQFTLRQLAILSLLTRDLDYKTISTLLCTTTADVFIAEGIICSKLRIPRSSLKSYKMLCKYGAIERGIPYKSYKIEPVMRRPGYFLVPRFYTLSANK